MVGLASRLRYGLYAAWGVAAMHPTALPEILDVIAPDLDGS
jgi:hypothetical protein